LQSTSAQQPVSWSETATEAGPGALPLGQQIPVGDATSAAWQQQQELQDALVLVRA
jgi:hypothetical protein